MIDIAIRLLVLSSFGGLAFMASAAVTTTVTWDRDTLLSSGQGKFSKDGISLTADSASHEADYFFNHAAFTFSAPTGSKFAKIEFINASYFYIDYND